MRLVVLGLAALVLAGCGKPAERGQLQPNAMFMDSGGFGKERMDRDEMAAATDAAAAAATDASASTTAAGPASAPGGSSAPSAVPAASGPMLAYEYSYTLRAPARGIRGLVAAHEKACGVAGPRGCQVTSSNIREMGDDNQVATLRLRASSAWLKTFRDSLAADARAAGGKIISAGVESEDLSRQIVDTEARLRAMTTLRDRLQALLASRPGKLSDLVEIERELARVQGEIDSTQSQLAVMRGRVEMSVLTLQYISTGTVAPDGVWSPLVKAVTDFVAIVVYTLAAMVRLIAWLAPWLLVGGGLIWLFRKRLPRRIWPFGRKTPPEAP